MALSRNAEVSVHELLNDGLTQLVMRSDNVDRARLEDALQQTQALLATMVKPAANSNIKLS